MCHHVVTGCSVLAGGPRGHLPNSEHHNCQQVPAQSMCISLHKPSSYAKNGDLAKATMPMCSEQRRCLLDNSLSLYYFSFCSVDWKPIQLVCMVLAICLEASMMQPASRNIGSSAPAVCMLLQSFDCAILGSTCCTILTLQSCTAISQHVQDVYFFRLVQRCQWDRRPTIQCVCG